jgi:hypothetical protein
MPFTAAVLAVGLAVAQQAVPTFHAGTNAIPVPVAVFSGDRVVRGLTAQDFQVRDNGVEQAVTDVEFNTLPIHLRLVFDTSGSISDKDLADFLRTMRFVASALEPNDECEIITFNSRIAEAASRQRPPIKIELARGGLEGTAFMDAVSLALTSVPTPERRQITIVLSDAIDNTSFFDEPTLLEAARMTDAVVYTILPGDPKFGRAISTARLQAISILTGGRLMRTPQRNVGDAIIAAITEFRQSYVVSYTLTGASIEGWHKIDVRVRGAKYRIRAKAGYFAR